MSEIFETHLVQRDIRSLLDELDNESDLVGYALQEAVIKIGNNWIDAVGDGFKGDLLSDLDELISRLGDFRENARLILPVENGGLVDRAASSGPESKGVQPESVAAGTKLVEVHLTAFTKVQYVEIVEVPSDLTPTELDDLASARYSQVDAGDFRLDPEFCVKVRCLVSDVDPEKGESPTMMVWRAEHGLQIEPADAASCQNMDQAMAQSEQG